MYILPVQAWMSSYIERASVVPSAHPDSWSESEYRNNLMLIHVFEFDLGKLQPGVVLGNFLLLAKTWTNSK